MARVNDNPASVRFEGFETMRGVHAWSIAFELATARLQDSDVLTDAPLAAHNYANPLRAHRRIDYISGLVEADEMRAFAVLHGRRAIGVASAVPASFPGSSEALEAAGIMTEQQMAAVEIDYWHADLIPPQAMLIDTRATKRLITEAVGLVGALGGDAALVWQAVPTNNTSERGACQNNGMVRVGEPGHIEIGDRVELERQLWAKPVAILG